jgi:uncharacterized protein
MGREDITFTSRGQLCAGWFYRADVEGRAPVVVMGHGLAAVKEMRLAAYAERFVAAGFHVLVFDYRHFGDSEGSPRQLLDIKKQHQDWTAAVTYARTRPDVDGTRVALWGSSLSGGHVLALGHQLGARAVVSQVPHTDGIAAVRATGLRPVVKLVPLALLDLLGSLVKRPPRYVTAAGAPGDTALMSSAEALDYLQLVPPGYDFDNRVAARFGLAIGLYSPGRKIKQLDMPVLVQVGSRDLTTPMAPAVKYAAGNPRVTVKRHDVGHFEPYLGETFELFVGEQLDFLTQHLA